MRSPPRPTRPSQNYSTLGFARIEWAETRLTNMGTPLGTPGYMSPEQAAGGEVDHRADLFALGGVLFECLVGQPPAADVGAPDGAFSPPPPQRRASHGATAQQALARLPSQSDGAIASGPIQRRTPDESGIARAQSRGHPSARLTPV